MGKAAKAATVAVKEKKKKKKIRINLEGLTLLKALGQIIGERMLSCFHKLVLQQTSYHHNT